MIRQSALLGHSCAAGANIIWGMMAPIAKVVMVGGLVTPLVLTDLRIFGAAVLVAIGLEVLYMHGVF